MNRNTESVREVEAMLSGSCFRNRSKVVIRILKKVSELLRKAICGKRDEA